MKKRKIILMLDSSRAADRGIIRGVVNYSNLRGEWTYYRSSPLFQKMPFSGDYYNDEIWQKLNTLEADGLIGYLPDDKTLLEKIRDCGFPAVILPVSSQVEGMVNISQDKKTGAMAAEYLLGLGFKNFGYCGMKYNWNKIRQKSFSDIIHSAGFDLSVAPEGASSSDLAQWLISLEQPVAIMACNDERAAELIQLCMECRIKIPTQAAVIGVDNDEMICTLTNPPLSSIQMNFETVGYNAAETIDRLLSGQEISDISELCCRPTEIICRASTDTLEIDDIEVANAVRFIRNNVRRAINVKDVHKNSMLSLRALQLRFRKALNRSINQEIHRERIAEMCRQLLNSNLTIQQIAYRMELGDIKHVSRIFKKETGMTPIEYKRKLGSK